MVLCRVCMKEKRCLFTMSSYSNNFYDITGIIVHQANDSFICKDCISRLLQAVEFRKQAITADEFFKSKVAKIKIEAVEALVEINERALLEEDPREKLEKEETFNEEKLFKIDDKVEIKLEAQTKYLKKIKTKLKVTKLKVKKQNPYICDFCKTEFIHKLKLLKHIRLNHMSYECNICNKKFNSARPLKNHYTNMHANLDESLLKPFLCDLCGRRCSTKYKLEFHTRTHTNYRPYPCTQCKAKFKQHSDLKTHVKSVHSNERPYLCLECGLSFKIRNGLRDHTKRKHNQQGMLSCKECDKKVMWVSELKNHIAVHHRGERNHVCKMCPKTYTKAYHLKRHYIECHKEEYVQMVENGEIRIKHRGPKIGEKINVNKNDHHQNIALQNNFS